MGARSVRAPQHSQRVLLSELQRGQADVPRQPADPGLEGSGLDCQALASGPPAAVASLPAA
eukprot:15079092-Alexandrium_andersonii.AAC.1